MSIIERKSVAEAYTRALALAPEDHDSAVYATAQALGLPVEAVLECVQELTRHA